MIYFDARPLRSEHHKSWYVPMDFLPIQYFAERRVLIMVLKCSSVTKEFCKYVAWNNKVLALFYD